MSVATLPIGWPGSAAAQFITEFATPTSNSAPQGITVGPDGALWFAEYFGQTIERSLTNGSIGECPATPGTSPGSIAFGSDGAFWFTDRATNKIGRVATNCVET